MAAPRLPYNLDAERQVLAAIMADDRLIWDVSEQLIPEDFHAEDHQAIFDASISLRDAGRPINPITISEALKTSKLRITPDDIQNIADDIINASARDTIAYAQQIAAQAELRSSIRALREAESRLLNLGTTEDHRRALDEVEALVLSAGRSRTAGGVWLHEAMREVIESIQRDWQNGIEQRGHSWGLVEADNLCGKLFPGKLYTVGAMAGFGKTALVLQTCLSIAREEPAAFYSLEMPREELAQRRFSSELLVSGDKINERTITRVDLSRMIEAARNEREINQGVRLHTGRMTIRQIKASAKRERRTYGVGVVVIDHLRLVQRELTTKAKDRLADYEHALDVTYEAKEMAKELNIPVIMLAQGKQSEIYARANSRPRPSDLYGGGAIEQNTDVLLFLHRPDIMLQSEKPAEGQESKMADWAERMERIRGKAELINYKRRGGSAYKSAWVRFNAERTRFESLTEKAEQKFDQGEISV